MKPTRTAKAQALKRITAQNRGRTVVKAQGAGKDLRMKRTPIVDACDTFSDEEDEDEVCRKMGYNRLVYNILCNDYSTARFC